MGKKQYVISQGRVSEFYDNLIESGRVTAEHIGSKEDFITSLHTSDDVVNYRNTLIKSGVFDDDAFGTNDDDFLRSFVEKKKRRFWEFVFGKRGQS